MKATIYITRQFKFDAAHHLPGHPGKCKNLHGHTWKVELTFRSWVDTETGEYGLDFGKIKDDTAYFENLLDHKDLNDIRSLSPSAEGIALYIWSYYRHGPEVDLPLVKVKVWESVLFPECYVTYKGGLK